MENSADRERSKRKTIRALASVIEEFRKYEQDINANAILIYLTVMAKPGISLKQIERAVRLSSSAVHRSVRQLSDQHWRKGRDGKFLPGHDLVVAVPDAFDPRMRVVAPTARGRKVMEMVIDHLTPREETA